MTHNQEANMSEVEPTKAEGPYYCTDDEANESMIIGPGRNDNAKSAVPWNYAETVVGIANDAYREGASSRDGELAASREKLETAEKKVNSAKQRLDTMLHVWELRYQDAFRSNAGDELRAISETLSAALSAVKEVGK